MNHFSRNGRDEQAVTFPDEEMLREKMVAFQRNDCRRVGTYSHDTFLWAEDNKKGLAALNHSKNVKK